MKKGILFMLTFALLLSLTACHHEGEEMHSETESEEMAEEATDLMRAEGSGFEYYTPERLAELKGSAPVALFFHAEWCATCLGIEKEIDDNLAMIPEGVTVLEANFDEDTELNKEYGVSSQSTLVFLDAAGNEVERLQGKLEFDQIKTALMTAKEGKAEAAAMEPAGLEEYSADKLATLEGSEPVAVFFHAEWCGTCVGIEEELEKNFAELPEGSRVMVADFDAETELKTKYGVSMHSTIVFLNASGEETGRLQGASTLEQISNELTKSLG